MAAYDSAATARGESVGKKVAIVGGGAAGFFCGIHMKELAGDTDVTIFERQSR